MNKIREINAVQDKQLPTLEQIDGDLNDIERGLQEAVTRLWSLHGRLVGPTAANSTSSTSESKPSGLVGKLSNSIITLRGLTLELHTLASDLERVV